MAIDLKGIRFRAYLPQLEDDEVYDPAGPDNADQTDGAIDLSPITFRSYEENDLDLNE